MNFKTGDKVKIRSSGITGKVVTIKGSIVTIEFDEYLFGTGDYMDQELEHYQPKLPHGLKCTCGSDSVPGYEGQHSNWCDKYIKD